MREEDEDYEQVTVAVPLVCIPSLCCRPASRTDRLYRFPGESYGGSCTCRFSGCFVCHGSYPVESSPQFLPAIIQAATRFPSGASTTVVDDGTLGLLCLGLSAIGDGKASIGMEAGVVAVARPHCRVVYSFGST